MHILMLWLWDCVEFGRSEFDLDSFPTYLQARLPEPDKFGLTQATRIECQITLTETEDEGDQDGAGEWIPLPIRQADILLDLARERERQNRLRDDGRFPFTAADASLTHTERLPMLAEELGEIARQVQEQPDSGLQPVTHAGKFDQRAAETGDAFKQRGIRKPIDTRRGTPDGLRNELIQLAAIAVAWCEAIDSKHGSTATVPNADAPA